jgi:hypothetical protein
MMMHDAAMDCVFQQEQPTKKSRGEGIKWSFLSNYETEEDAKDFLKDQCFYTKTTRRCKYYRCLEGGKFNFPKV